MDAMLRLYIINKSQLNRCRFIENLLSLSGYFSTSHSQFAFTNIVYIMNMAYKARRSLGTLKGNA